MGFQSSEESGRTCFRTIRRPRGSGRRDDGRNAFEGVLVMRLRNLFGGVRRQRNLDFEIEDELAFFASNPWWGGIKGLLDEFVNELWG